MEKIIYKDDKGLYFVSYNEKGEPFKTYCDEQGNPLPITSEEKQKNKVKHIILAITGGVLVTAGLFLGYAALSNPFPNASVTTKTEQPQTIQASTKHETKKLTADEILSKAVQNYENAPKIKLEESSETHKRTLQKENKPNYLYKDIVSYSTGDRFETYIKDKVIHTFDTIDNKWETSNDTKKFNISFSASGIKPLLDYKTDYKLEENENAYVITFEPKDIEKFNKILHSSYDYDQENYYKKYSQIITIDKNSLLMTKSVYNTTDYEDEVSSTTQVFKYDDKETITFPEQVTKK